MVGLWGGQAQANPNMARSTRTRHPRPVVGPAACMVRRCTQKLTRGANIAQRNELPARREWRAAAGVASVLWPEILESHRARSDAAECASDAIPARPRATSLAYAKSAKIGKGGMLSSRSIAPAQQKKKTRNQPRRRSMLRWRSIEPSDRRSFGWASRGHLEESHPEGSHPEESHPEEFSVDADE